MEDLVTSYQAYAAKPGPDTLNAVVGHLGDTINASLASHGVADDPTIRTKARAMTVKAVKTYDPSAGAGLHTWVSRQLQGLSRVRRTVYGMGMPERAQLDIWSLHKGEQELEDKLGRSPDIAELSDHLGMPVKKVAKLRAAKNRGVGTDALDGMEVRQDDKFDEAAHYLLPELDLVSRKVLEHRSGFGGAPIRGVVDLAKELNVSPATITNKGAYLAARLREIEGLLHG